MDLLLTDLDAQLHARLPTYQHALTNGKPFASILAGLRKLHESLEPSRKAPVMTSTGDSEDSALGKFDRAPAGLPDNSLREAIHSAPFQNAVRKIGSIDLSTPTGPLEVIKEVFLSDSMILQRYVIFQEAALATKHEIFGVIQGVRHHLGRYLGSVVAMENGSVPPGLEDFSLGETERLMHAQRVAAKTTSLTRFADPPLMPKHELMLRNGATTRRSTSTTPREARASPQRSRRTRRGTWSRPWRCRRSFATLTCSAGSKPSGAPSSPRAASMRTRAVPTTPSTRCWV